MFNLNHSSAVLDCKLMKLQLNKSTVLFLFITYVFHFRCILFFKYADLIKDPGMYPVNFMGTVLNLAYLACYYIYSEDKVCNNTTQFLFYVRGISILWFVLDCSFQASVVKTIGKAILFFGSILLYVQMEDPEKVLFRFGIITTVLMFLLIASPLFQLVSNQNLETWHTCLCNITEYHDPKQSYYATSRLKWCVHRALSACLSQWYSWALFLHSCGYCMASYSVMPSFK